MPGSVSSDTNLSSGTALVLHVRSVNGYPEAMSHQRKRQDPQIEDVPSEEDVDRADAVDRLGLDPDKQENYPEQKHADGERESGAS